LGGGGKLKTTPIFHSCPVKYSNPVTKMGGGDGGEELEKAVSRGSSPLKTPPIRDTVGAR